MENENKLISVVIPCYNRADTITACLESVLRQTYNNIEVIVVDDGSTDGTEKLFESCCDSRVRYCRCSQNRGACHARNYGAELSSGDFIAFQDSDDLWRADKLRRQYDRLLASGADLVFCGMERISVNGESYYYPVHHFDDSGDALRQLLMENRAGTQTMLMRRKVWQETKFDESFKRYQDWDFILRVSSRWFKLSYLPEALVDSAVSESSISASVSSVPALEHLYEAHRAEFERYPDCLSRYYLRLARRLRKEKPLEAARLFWMSLSCRKGGSAKNKKSR